jgi:hypothetical protein
MLLLLLACFDTADLNDAETPDAPAALIPSAAPPALDGQWSYAEECGESAGGTPVVVGYSLTVTGATATLYADGYQTMTRIVADLEPSGDAAWTLRFSHSEPDAMFPDAYQKGEALLALTLDGSTLSGRPLGLVLNCSESMSFSR